MMTVSVGMFMYAYPMRNAQYLVPIAIFVALYAADAMVVFMRLLRGGSGMLFAVLLLFVWQINMQVNRQKFFWTNGENKAVVSWALTHIPKDAYVLDFEGATIFYRDPYYVCCLPFGQYTTFVSRPFPSLIDVLEKTQTGYIYEGRSGRIAMLSQSEQAYIARVYTKVPGTQFLKRK
jgi:hypothetical protein